MKNKKKVTNSRNSEIVQIDKLNRNLWSVVRFSSKKSCFPKLPGCHYHQHNLIPSHRSIQAEISSKSFSPRPQLKHDAIARTGVMQRRNETLKCDTVERCCCCLQRPHSSFRTRRCKQHYRICMNSHTHTHTFQCVRLSIIASVLLIIAGKRCMHTTHHPAPGSRCMRKCADLSWYTQSMIMKAHGTAAYWLGVQWRIRVGIYSRIYTYTDYRFE